MKKMPPGAYQRCQKGKSTENGSIAKTEAGSGIHHSENSIHEAYQGTFFPIDFFKTQKSNIRRSKS